MKIVIKWNKLLWNREKKMSFSSCYVYVVFKKITRKNSAVASFADAVVAAAAWMLDCVRRDCLRHFSDRLWRPRDDPRGKQWSPFQQYSIFNHPVADGFWQIHPFSKVMSRPEGGQNPHTHQAWRSIKIMHMDGRAADSAHFHPQSPALEGA